MMIDKIKCNTCKLEKDLTEFYFRKETNSYRKQCKVCRRRKDCEYSQKNKEKKKESYLENRPERLKKYKLYYQQNKDRLNNCPNRKQKQKEWCSNNKNRIKQTKKIYEFKNKDKINKRKRKYESERYKEDVIFKLIKITRTRINQFLESRGYSKKSKTSKMIGCTYEELKIHLEKQFTKDMSWNKILNSEIELDHIIPISSAKNEEELFKLCHFSNLQPLWRKDNSIKSNKVTFKEIVF